MRIYHQEQSREEYFKTQIEASRKKFRYCKVSSQCVEGFKEIIYRSNNNAIKGPILCLGTRNGREIDLFRKVFFGSVIDRLVMKLNEKREFAFSSRSTFLDARGRSDIKYITKKSVVGVELNPEGARTDVYVGSFDELPQDWTSRFNIVYSNSFDHAYDPHKTASEWSRVLVSGGYLILGLSAMDSPSHIGRVGDVGLGDINMLFGGEIIYFNKFGNCFPDVIIRK